MLISRTKLPEDFWSSLVSERLLLMNGAAVRQEAWRDEKLRLLRRFTADLADWDPCFFAFWPALSWWLRLPLLPPLLLPPALDSLPLLLRLLLFPQLTPVLQALLPDRLPPSHEGVGAAKSLDHEKETQTECFSEHMTEHLTFSSDLWSDSDQMSDHVLTPDPMQAVQSHHLRREPFNPDKNS